MNILDGKLVKESIISSIKEELATLLKPGEKVPRIDVILVGSDPGSKKYVQMKTKVAQELGFISVSHTFDQNVTQEHLIDKIEELNIYPDIDGFFIQLPLPEHLNTEKILNVITPEKDVDGLTAVNLGKLYQGSEDAVLSATPRGIMMLLNYYKIGVERKHVTLVGWSKIVGMPLLAVLANHGATVTVCHDKTADLESHTSNADILISATGVRGLIKGKHVKDGAIVIDVGISVDDNGVIAGDIEPNSVMQKASWLTPVPGGVGPMTVAALMLNTFEVWKRKRVAG